MLDATLGLVFVLASTACDRDPAPAAPPAPAPYRHAPGPAYLAVEGAGVFRLDDAGFTRVLAHRFPASALAVAPDGALIVTAIGGTWRIEGERVEPLAPPSLLSLTQLAIGPDGVVWATDGQALWRWDGAWTTEPAATFDGELIADLAVDARGQVWVLQAAALWRLARNGWHQVDLAFTGTRTPFLSDLAIATDGAIHVAGLPGVFAYRGGAWQRLPFPARGGGADHLTAGLAGHLAATSGVTAAVLASPAGRIRIVDLAGTSAAARHLRVLAVDGAGRTWLTTDDGVLVLDADGAVARQWRPGTLPALSGRVTAVAVVGDGPALPAPGPPRTGTVTGLVTRGDRPVAGATIELCDRPYIGFTTTPCETATSAHRATTGADGRFAIRDVPVSSRGVAVRGARWTVLHELDCCSALATTDHLDLGRISLR